MCHQPMKFSDMFDQNPPSTFDKISEKLIRMEKVLTLKAKVKAIVKKSKDNAPGNNKHVVHKNLLTITEIGQPRSRVIR